MAVDPIDLAEELVGIVRSGVGHHVEARGLCFQMLARTLDELMQRAVDEGQLAIFFKVTEELR